MKKALLTFINFSLAICLLALSNPVSAFAASGAHHGKPSFSDIIPYWIHFIVYIALLYYLLKSKVISAWKTRRLNLEDSVMKGERELAAAQQSLDAARTKLASLESEISNLKQSISHETKQEAQRIIDEAKAQAERILQQGKSSAAAEERSAERSVQNELAELVIRRAREIIQSEVNEASDKKYRDAALSSVNSLLQ